MLIKHPLALLMTSYLIVLVWSSLTLTIVLFLYGLAFHSLNVNYLYTSFCFFMVCSAISIILMFFNKCPNCNKYLLFEGIEEKHSEAYKIKGVDYWASLVISVVMKKKLVCMHCGMRLARSP